LGDDPSVYPRQWFLASQGGGAALSLSHAAQDDEEDLGTKIGYSEAIPAYERNLLDALMKPVHLDVFEYILHETWNIATNPLRSCGFAPYIQFMIEMVAHERFYKDVKHE
jgi:hypothetical protein